MKRFRLASAALWCSLLGLAFFTAPPAAPDTSELIGRLVTGQLEGVNLSLFALFNLMGVWPLAMAVALRGDAVWWKWPFILGSFVLGAFVLLPYFVLRPWLAPPQPETSFITRVLSSHWMVRALGVAAVCFGALFFFGGLGEFAQLFRTQQFPYVMSLDFFAFCGAALLLVLERTGRAHSPTAS
jgi:hypothetical protein